LKRIFRILGLSMVVVAILAVALAGTVLAAGPNTDNGAQTQTQNQGEECICGECPCEECPCGGGICSCYNWAGEPGPHGVQNCNGNLGGEEAPYGEGTCNCYNWAGEPGPHGK